MPLCNFPSLATHRNKIVLFLYTLKFMVTTHHITLFKLLTALHNLDDHLVGSYDTYHFIAAKSYSTFLNVCSEPEQT